MSTIKNLCPEVELCLFALSIIICRADINSTGSSYIEATWAKKNKNTDKRSKRERMTWAGLFGISRASVVLVFSAANVQSHHSYFRVW
jgi:hypothetical protein